MAPRTRAIVLLALLCAAALCDTAVAVDNARRLRDRTLQARSKRVVKANSGVHAQLQTLARAGAFRSAAKAHAFLDHAMAGKLAFEGFEHAYGSGYEAHAGNADAITFSLVDVGKGELYTTTTADQVLRSEDGVLFSYSEMTAVAGDYWAPKDANENIICNLNLKSINTAPRLAAGQRARFEKAFNDMWSNPDYGLASSKRGAEMLAMEGQLRAMMAKERLGVFTGGADHKQFPTEQHGGSKYYETSKPDFLGNVRNVVYETTITSGPLKGKVADAIADGNGRALQINDDHFWTCAQDTYVFGHREAVHAAWAAGQLAVRLGVVPTNMPVRLHVPSGNPQPAGPAAVAAAAAAMAAPAPALEREASLSFDSPMAAPNTAVAPAAKPVGAARTAALQNVQNALVRAYAMDGFVSHFLSDQFSAGHLRTPRVELRSQCSFLTDGGKEAGMTANVMHDEDNWNCLLVRDHATPAAHNVWWACGDHRFFDQENAMNRRRLHDAIAASVQSVSSAFIDGLQSYGDPSAAADFATQAVRFIGTTEGLTKRQAVENTCPLYRPSAAGGVQQRSGPLSDFPRPAAAKKFAFGSSLRWNMKAEPFPAYVDMTHASVHSGDLNEADAAFVARLGADVTAADLTCDAPDSYRAFVGRQTVKQLVKFNDCCAVLGRATPEFIKEKRDKSLPAPLADNPAVEATAWPNSESPTATHLRVTYKNSCFFSQSVSAAVHSAAQNVKAVAKAGVQSLPSLGQAMAAGLGGVVIPIAH